MTGQFFHEREYYVYEVIVDQVVRYVGKGRGRRARRHIGIAESVTQNDKHRYARSRFYKALGSAIEAGSRVEIRYVSTGLSSEEAFRQEVSKIALYGLANLWNSTPGGEGCCSDVARACAKERWTDPAKRQRHSERLKDAYRDPLVQARHKAALKRNLTTEERLVRAKNANSRWAKPGTRERQAAVSKSLQAARAARRNANLFCGALSFGC